MEKTRTIFLQFSFLKEIRNAIDTEYAFQTVKVMYQPLYKLHKENELMPSMMYLLREILPVFQKWPYYNSARKELIGQKCLKIAHKILNLRAVGARKKPGKPHLQEVCVYSLLYTEAGRALLEIIATGVDTVELLLSQQSRFIFQAAPTGGITSFLVYPEHNSAMPDH